MARMNVDNEKMCRKCFSGFERHFKLVSILKNNLAKSVESQLCQEAQEPEPIIKRRKIATDSAIQPLQDDKDEDEASSSPSVSVYKYNNIVIYIPLLFIPYALDSTYL